MTALDVSPGGRADDPTDDHDGRRLRVCVVGSGTRFVSGISYYTYFLNEALARRFDTSVVLMRNLVPRRLYPGRDRVGAAITDLDTSDVSPTFDGVDWFPVPSLARAGRFVRDQDPDVLVLQWWTGAVLLSFLHLCRVARRRGAKVVIEFHEDQDTGETALPLVERAVRPGLARLIRRSDHFVVHSAWDRDRLCAKFGLDPADVTVVPHGPYAIGGDLDSEDATTGADDNRAVDARPDDEVTVLFFGTIRPYKGLEDLVDAFDRLPRHGPTTWKLLVVGETWEGWDLPATKIAASPYAADIEFVNRYVADDELPGIFGRADVVALPYLRSSASGPLHLTMQRGLPVVITEVGGLVEAARDYPGTVFVPAGDPDGLAAGLVAGAARRGTVHEDPHTWDHTLELYTDVIDGLTGRVRAGAPVR